VNFDKFGDARPPHKFGDAPTPSAEIALPLPWIAIAP